jgi:hypothetical protein
MTRDKDRVMLAHEKSNLGPQQDSIELEFDARAKVFRRFGEVVSTAVARSALRSAHRKEILRAFEQAATQGLRISMADRANNSARKVVERLGMMPAISKPDFDSVVAWCRADGLLAPVPYTQANGTSSTHLAITDAGRAVAAL